MEHILLLAAIVVFLLLFYRILAVTFYDWLGRRNKK